MRQFNLILKEDGTIDTTIWTYDEYCNRICKRITIDNSEKLVRVLGLAVKDNFKIFAEQVSQLNDKLVECAEVINKMVTNKE